MSACPRGQDDFESWLSEFLPKFSRDGIFSRSGSGDDVSVSGIVDLDKVASHTEEYEYDVKLYALEEDLFWKEDELRGKARKHGILKNRFDDAQLVLVNAKTEQNNLENTLSQYRNYRAELERRILDAKEELEDYRQKASSASKQVDANIFPSAAQIFRKKV